MKLSLENIVKYGNETVIKECYSSNGNFRILLELEEIDETVELSFKSQRAELNIPESDNLAYRTCTIEFVSLSDLLDTENGIYVPQKKFSDFMQQNRRHLNLAYGLKQRDYPWILSFNGSARLASFIVRNQEDISITSHNIETM